MTDSEASWLKFWEIFATAGFILVIIGVVVEGVEHFKKFTRKEHARKLHIEKIGWLILVAGLAMEFLGDHAAKRISSKESARLNKEAGDARRDAGEAIKQAGEANERAAKFDADREFIAKQAGLIRSTNLVLQAKVLELEARLQPRTIVPKQRQEFIDLLSTVPKGPLRIGATNPNQETRYYRDEIVSLVRDAGYSIQSYMDYGSAFNIQTKAAIGVVINGVNQNEEVSSRARTLANAFQLIGVDSQLIAYKPTSAISDIVIETNEVLIYVFEKP